MPAFNQRIIDSFIPTINEESAVLVEQMSKYVGKGYFDALTLIDKCTLDMFFDTSIGLKVHSQTTETQLYKSWIETMFDYILLRTLSPIYFFDFTCKLTKFHKHVMNITKEFHEVINDAIRKRRRLFDEHKKSVQFEDVRRNKVFMDLLLELSEGNRLTDKEMLDQINTFIIGGSDTIAHSLSSLLVMLGMHPEIQDKLYEELIDILGPQRFVEQTDLSKMKYTENVIKEGLRLFPVVPITGRDIEEDILLDEEKGIILPKGSTAFLLNIHIHRNEKYWTEPMKFDPDRWQRDDIAKQHPCTFVPFSAGPRNCPGPKYAMMAMKILLSHLIRSYRFTTSYKSVQDIKLRYNIMMRTVDGYQVAVECRQNE